MAEQAVHSGLVIVSKANQIKCSIKELESFSARFPGLAAVKRSPGRGAFAFIRDEGLVGCDWDNV